MQGRARPRIRHRSIPRHKKARRGRLRASRVNSIHRKRT
jgi:hypothetical protein